MSGSGNMRGVAAASVASVLAVGALPLFTGTAHTELTRVVIVNERDRGNVDTDELRDNDDFTIETRNEDGVPADEDVVPDYRWVIDPSAVGAAEVVGEWVPARPKKGPGSAGIFVVTGPSRQRGDDGIRDRQVQDGTWTLEARVTGTGLTDATTVRASESEITLDEGDARSPAEGTNTVSGTLANDGGGLGGRGVLVTYTTAGAGDAGIDGEPDNTVTVSTDGNGAFSVTLRDPAGPAGAPDDWESGTVTATASGETANDGTQLLHDTGPDDSVNPDADATDKLAVTWVGSGPPPDKARIAVALKGRSNGARDDRVKAIAPGKARGAEVRLLKKTRSGRLQLVQVKQLNRRGDRRFVVHDRNGRRFTQYVVKVRPTVRTTGDRGRRRLR